MLRKIANFLEDMLTTPVIDETSPPMRLHSRRRRIYWTLGNLLFFAGLYLLIYVGGIYAYIDFLRQAARGDSPIELPADVLGASSQALLPLVPLSVPASQRPTQMPAALAAARIAEGQIASIPPEPNTLNHHSTIERLVLPSIKLDTKVVAVGWDVVKQDGQTLALWQVAEFVVGHHQGSANPGEGNNIVLAGHVAGYGHIFRDLYYVLPGDPVVIYSEGKIYRYRVSERQIVLEDGAPLAQRFTNARMIAPTGSEMVTMVTCWPATGPDKFTERVIIRALPETPTN